MSGILKCPFCGERGSTVVNSRLHNDGKVTVRRRECEHCMKRFNTLEAIEDQDTRGLRHLLHTNAMEGTKTNSFDNPPTPE
jgi:transcriptional regulator NrdR family protein